MVGDATRSGSVTEQRRAKLERPAAEAERGRRAATPSRSRTNGSATSPGNAVASRPAHVRQRAAGAPSAAPTKRIERRRPPSAPPSCRSPDLPSAPGAISMERICTMSGHGGPHAMPSQSRSVSGSGCAPDWISMSPPRMRRPSLARPRPRSPPAGCPPRRWRATPSARQASTIRRPRTPPRSSRALRIAARSQDGFTAYRAPIGDADAAAAARRRAPGRG